MDRLSTSFSLEGATPETIAAQADHAAARLHQVKFEIAKRILGQGQVVDQVLVALLSGSHALIVGLPGLAKTKLVETLGRVLALEEKRVQFTPDLLPGDILGSELLETDAQGSRHFRFVKGPVFCQLLMADEINRASPRTQSALLQAMQEHHVTVAGTRYELPAPFHVLATQNPIEQEGTYPLPEAQLDRFLMQVNVDYPSREAERAMLLATTGIEEADLKTILEPGELIELQKLVRLMPVGDSLVDAILDLVRAARPENQDGDLLWGPGPRAAQALMLGSRAHALLYGRLAPSADDVRALAPAVMRHRMALSFSARAAGKTVDSVIADLLAEWG